MRLSSLEPRSRHWPAFLGVIAAAHVAACADDSSDDDESAAEAGSVADSGGATSDEGSEDETTEITDPADAGTVSDSGSIESSCQRVTEACSDFEDPVEEGLGELCLRVAAQESAEQCQAIEADCLLYCALDSEYEEPPLDGDLACEQMGDLCHDADHGTGLENLCHETGHSENPAWCLAIYDECQTVCDGLAQSDAGSHGHADGGHSVSDGGDAGSL